MEKICIRCKKNLVLDLFYKHPRMKDGRLNKCKNCCKQEQNQTRKNRVEYYREFDRKRSGLLHRVLARQEYAKTQNGKNAHKRAVEKYKSNNPQKVFANNVVNSAIKEKKIIPMPCVYCGKKAHAHHEDYSKPLDVIWLCPAHHKKRHAEINKEVNGEQV